MERDRLFEVARRTFDTPEFRGIEFIEVEAKSIINHVPGSFLPFNWTINPYRGCSHSCTYCFARVTHTYMDLNAGRDFESKIYVKINAAEVLIKPSITMGMRCSAAPNINPAIVPISNPPTLAKVFSFAG